MTFLLHYGMKHGKFVFMFSMAIVYTCMMFCDVITDGLIVSNSRLDPEKGAANLNSLCRIANASGYLIGCLGVVFLQIFMHGISLAN